jgi:hypothetical protein
MNKRDYIQSRLEKILKENINEKADAILQRLNYKKEAPFNPEGSAFDYVQEEEGGECSECGGEMREGECSECGYMKEDLNELGGMDDGHPRFGHKNLSKLSKDELDAILNGDDEEEEEFDFDYNDDDDEWEEVDMEIDEEECNECGDSYELEEKLYGNQSKLDKNKNGRLDSDDFKMLRSKRRKHIEEYTMGDNDIESVKSYGDTSTDSPNITPKNLSKARVKNTGDKYQRKVSKEFDDYESEQEEGTLYEIAIERTIEESSDKFIQKAEKEIDKKGTKGKFGSWCKRNGLASAEGEVTKRCIDKAMKSDDSEVVKMANFAKNIGGFHGAKHKKTVKESALFTESEVIELIEKIIKEEEKKFKAGREPRGYAEYERVHRADKKEEDDYMKALAKKMKDYLKDSTKGEYKESPEKFPQSNYEIDKNAKVKKYVPSQAVDDYQDAFSYPGMTNLVYDEIKPNDKNIEKYLKGDSTTGNAQVDKDGKALGNVVPSEVGEKFFKNYKDNLYGQEQMDASYKRQPQPVDQAGEETERGSLKSKRGKKTSQSVLNKLEEGVNDKETQKLNEEFNRMKSLMGYTDKTQ